MNQSKLVVCFGIGLGLVAGACAGAPAQAEEVTASDEALSAAICPAGVPVALAPAADQTIKATLTGVGVQIYICSSTPTGAFAWAAVAPRANLLDDCDKLVGTHFIGPTWQGNDGSSVSAAKAAGATLDPSAVPWLLLKVTGNGPIAGRFSDVTAIQRLSTVGGIAPSTPCDITSAGVIAQVPYTAQYVFYKTKTHGKVVQCNGT